MIFGMTHPPDVLPTALQLRASLSQLQRALRNAAGSPDGLGASALSVLALLSRHGPLPPAAIARLERVRPQSLTRVLGDLEAEGFVRRSADAADARRILLALTEAGARRLGDEVHRREAPLAEAVARSLTAPERARLRAACRVMDRLADALADATEAAEAPGAATR